MGQRAQDIRFVSAAVRIVTVLAPEKHCDSHGRLAVVGDFADAAISSSAAEFTIPYRVWRRNHRQECFEGNGEYMVEVCVLSYLCSRCSLEQLKGKARQAIVGVQQVHINNPQILR
jgi:hypothetical protein